MTTKLAAHCKAQRLEWSLTLGQLAKRVGYRNLSKGARRLDCFERTGVIQEDLLVKVAEALDIEWTTIEGLAEKDWQEHVERWEKWVSEPVPMRLVIRIMAAIYNEVDLPKRITTPEQAERFACWLAWKKRMKVCLVVSRRLSIWIDEAGQVYARTEATPDGDLNQPYMGLKSSPRKFLLSCDRISKSQGIGPASAHASNDSTGARELHRLGVAIVNPAPAASKPRSREPPQTPTVDRSQG